MSSKRTGSCRLTVWLLAIALPSLTACAGTVGIGIARTPTATETHSTPPMTPTMPAATAAPTAEPAPTSATSGSGDDVIPFGLIYRAADALWQVNANGESVRILEPFGDGYLGPVVSPNGTQVLYTEAEDIWLADIATGERRNVTQTPDRSECCARWWPNQPHLILFSSWTSEDAGHNFGFPTVVRPDGGQYHVLDDEQVCYALPAPSPDGRTVAYDRAGQPWLYRTDTGPEPFEFDLTLYDPLSDPQLTVASPAWSPDGTELAWVIGGNFAALGGWRIGTGVFDLKSRAVSLLRPYEPIGQGGWPPAPIWDPDGRWLLFSAWAWNTDETGAWIVRADGQREEEHHLGPCSTPVWSPDGRWLACTSYPQGSGARAWLVEIGTWRLQPLDLPADVYLVAWISPSGPLPPTATPTPEPTPLPTKPTAAPLSPTPTFTPASAAERILFAPGATQTTVEGYLPTNGTKGYVMRVVAGQFVEMSATVGTMGQGLRFSIVGADGVVVKAMDDAHVRTVVPRTQDYYVELASDVGAVSYQMSVLIPVRIRFAPGATSAEVEGSLAANGVRHYVLRALAGQRMIVEPRATQGQVGMVISGADGQVLLSGRIGRPGGVYDGILPATQDYLIAVRAEGGTGADYTLEITIPPL